MNSTAFVTGVPTVASRSTTFAGANVCTQQRPTTAKWTMAKVAKFGPFTPAVVTAKLFIGEKNLNKLRGKGIALHSQAITAFCEFTGAGPKMRQSLIRTAKDNGNTLGFLS